MTLPCISRLACGNHLTGLLQFFFEKHLGPFGFLLSPLPVVLVVVYLCYIVGFDFFSFCGMPIGTEKYNIYT